MTQKITVRIATVKKTPKPPSLFYWNKLRHLGAKIELHVDKSTLLIHVEYTQNIPIKPILFLNPPAVEKQNRHQAEQQIE